MLIKGSRNENEGRREDFGKTRGAILEIKEFKAVVNKLLSVHYAIGINDTPLSDDTVVASYIESQTRPYQAVNDWAEEADLYRTDIQGAWGVPENRPLLAEQEEMAIKALNSIAAHRGKPSGPSF